MIDAVHHINFPLRDIEAARRKFSAMQPTLFDDGSRASHAASSDGRSMLLAEFTAQDDRRLRVDTRCIVMGWLLRSQGRKHEVGTALFDQQGALIGRARGLWIEPRELSVAGTAGSSPRRRR